MRKTLSKLYRKLVCKPSIRSRPEVCVWCLSTGRVGSQTLQALAKLSKEVVAVHEPEPKLFGLSKLAYIHEANAGCLSVIEESVKLSRHNLRHLRGKVYVETSPQLTFLGPALREAFPSSKFIHVVRHPAAVVCSGMRRGWYSGHPYDPWRIVPVSGPAADSWGRLTPFEKNVWLWTETNLWIRKFMRTLPEGDGLTVKSEDIFKGDPSTIASVFEHLGVTVPSAHDVSRVVAHPLNQQKSGDFPGRSEWEESEVEILRSYSGELCELYGYTI